MVSITIVAKSFSSRRLGVAMALYSMLGAPFHLLLIKAIGSALTDKGYGSHEVWGGVGAGASWAFADLALAGPRSFAIALRYFHGGKSVGGEHALAGPGDAGFLGVRTDDFPLGNDLCGRCIFNVAIFKERGFDERLYFNVLALVTIIALGHNLFFGWLVNYVRLNYLLAACLLATAASL